MRRTAVLTLLLAVLVVTVGDPLCCADGCGQSDVTAMPHRLTAPYAAPPAATPEHPPRT